MNSTASTLLSFHRQTFRFLPLLAFVAGTLFSSRAVMAASPFEPFLGTYSKNGHVQVFEGEVPKAKGRAKIRIRQNTDGTSARIRISGKLVVAGATRTYNTVLILRALSVAASTNLAPGIDDGYEATEGTYTISPRDIRARIPFVFGTTTGSTNVSVRLRKQKGVSRILIQQSLTTSSLVNSYTWRFTARARQ